MKSRPKNKTLTFGEFIAGGYDAWGARRAVGIVRLALNAHWVNFGRRRSIEVSSAS